MILLLSSFFSFFLSLCLCLACTKRVWCVFFMKNAKKIIVRRTQKMSLGRGVHKSERIERRRRKLLFLLLLFGEQEEKMFLRVVVAKCFILFVAIYLNYLKTTIRWSSSARLPSARRNSLSLSLSFLFARLRDRQLFLAKRRRIFRIIHP